MPDFETQLRVARMQGILWGIAIKIAADLIYWVWTHNVHITWSAT